MKKTTDTRNMARAFIKYAKLGLYDIDTSPFDAYTKIKGACGKNKRLAKELWAVHECLLIFGVLQDRETVRALCEIYLKPFSRSYAKNRADKTEEQGSLEKNEISYLIQRFAMKNFLDVRTVYRRLQKARKIWTDLLKK